ncbi:RHS repeat-associated core domain-containing protein [Burkholderia sp. RS02]|uniref:RHS repeat-associated core domain-containing protein n=1 Tax=unclassified Burkholderia TaxID=2613784 RepID=UPI0032182873
MFGGGGIINDAICARPVRASFYAQGEVTVESESFKYDGLGRLALAVNDQSRVQCFYDPVGNLAREHMLMRVEGSEYEFVWRHEYDEVGARVATIRPDGHRLDWLTYGSGHVHGVMLDGRTVANFERDDSHRETQRELGNGLTQTTHYDEAGRLARQLLQGTGRKVMERRYQYDAAGQLTQITDLRRGEIQYAYDPIGRLTRAQSSLGVETFSFDPASNIAEAKERDEHGIGVLGGARSAPLLDNLLKDYAGIHFAYDEMGNLKQRTRNGERTDFEWSSLGRMVSARDRHMQATYTYDALGRRIAKLTEPLVPYLAGADSGWRDTERQRLKQERGYGFTLYGWDGDMLAYETAWERRETTHYVYEPGSFTPLALATGPAMSDDGDVAASAFARIAYYHCDQIGTPQEVSDESGEVAWSVRYKAWGEAREVISGAARKAGITNPLRFAGQYFDSETGLHYNRHRYYDPSSGRFVSKDPIGLAGGINVYQYAPNPVGWIDPLGLSKQCAKCLPSCNDYTSRGLKNEEEMARELSGQINQNSVTFSTPTTQGHIDLQGASHFDKATGVDIPTPHVQTRKINVGPNGQVTTSKKTEVTRAATKQDVRVARELARRKGLCK